VRNLLRVRQADWETVQQLGRARFILYYGILGEQTMGTVFFVLPVVYIGKAWLGLPALQFDPLRALLYMQVLLCVLWGIYATIRWQEMVKRAGDL
jgi:hypothetical protein